MAIPRQSLTALDGFDNRIDWSAWIDRANGRILRWLSGGSFLAAHLAVFGTVFLAAFSWALIDHPTDLTTLEPFRVWGIVALVHLVLAGGWQVVSRVMGLDEPDWVSDGVPAYRRPQPEQSAPAMPAMVWARSVDSAARVNTTARRWAAASTRRSTADSESGSWPSQPAILLVDERVDVGEVTWPDSAPLSTTLLGSSATTANPSDELVSIDPAVQSVADPSQKWLDGFVESRSKEKEQRWSWVEAAAASWLSRRETPGQEQVSSAAPEDVVVPTEAVAEHDSDSPAS